MDTVVINGVPLRSAQRKAAPLRHLSAGREDPAGPSSGFGINQTTKKRGNRRRNPGKDERSRTAEKQASFLPVMVRRFAERAQDQNPALGLETLWKLDRDIRDQVFMCVMALRADGCSWREIGDLVGITPQAAFSRWGRSR